MKGFELVAEGVVDPSWIDANGHMNVMWYTALFDQGCDGLLRAVGITPETIAAGSTTVVAARLLTSHRRELREGDAWQLWSALCRADPAGLVFVHRLTTGGAAAATCEIHSHAFSPVTRRAASLPDEVVERAQRFLVPGMTPALQL